MFLSSDISDSYNRRIPDNGQHPLAAHHVTHATSMWEPGLGADRADGIHVSRLVMLFTYISSSAEYNSCFMMYVTAMLDSDSCYAVVCLL